MKEWKVIFAAAVIFGAGVISGGLLVNYADVSSVGAFWTTHHSTSPDDSTAANSAPKTTRSHLPVVLSERFVNRLQTELQLTPQQRADIEKIMADGQDEAREEFRDLRLKAHEKIRQRLTPEQVEKFDALLKRLHSRHMHNATNTATASPPEDASAGAGGK